MHRLPSMVARLGFGTRAGLLAVAFATTSGCNGVEATGGTPPSDGGGASQAEPEANSDGGPVTEPEGPQPFAPRDVDNHGLTNVSADLNAVLEDGALSTACEQWELDRENERKRLLCGKAMFFYEGFGTLGVPAPIMEFLNTELPEAGRAQSNFGLIEDPFAETPRPLGNGPGAPLGDVETYAYTCAACHFGQLPDGRYAVGAPNHEYDYGLQTLSLFVVPLTAGSSFDPSEHDPLALERVQPMIDRIEGDSALKWRLRFDLLPLLFAGGNANIPEVTPEVERAYAIWKPGTMDFVMAPLPLDDNIHTVSKIIPLWDIPREEERDAYGMEHAQLAWTGGAHHLMGFLEGFVAIGGGEPSEWPAERLQPLHDYILTLTAPQPVDALDDEERLRGEAIFYASTFEEQGCESCRCVDCHDGPSGEGTRLFTYEEIGTDATMAGWGEGTVLLDDVAEEDFPFGLKSPRLRGVFGQRRLLHNGSLDTLEELLCLQERPLSAPAPQSNEGHRFGCDTLSDDDKRALLTFLRSL